MVRLEYLKRSRCLKEGIGPVSITHRGMRVNCVYNKLGLIKSAILGKLLPDTSEQLVAGGRKVTGHPNQMIVTAFYCKCRNRNGSLDLSRDPLVKLSHKVYSSTLGYYTDLAPAYLYLIHRKSP